jgi:hypothetical protein
VDGRAKPGHDECGLRAALQLVIDDISKKQKGTAPNAASA